MPNADRSTRSPRALVLCGHTDTVPALEAEWRHDPFQLEEAADRWSGRGTCDMKGFLALAIDAFVRRQSDALSAPLALLLTSDEEIGSLGVRRFLDDERLTTPLPRNVLIGEPTELAVIRLHKGHLRGHLDFHGISAHSGHPDRGVSAIEAAARAIVALSDLQKALRTERRRSAEHFPDVPFEVLNPARIRGGEAINVVPDHCRVDFGLRLLPGSDSDELIERIGSTVGALGLAAEWELVVDRISPPLETAESADLYRELARLRNQQETRAAAFSSDAGVLSQHGHECVLFGPGSITVAHKPNEYLPKGDFEEAAGTIDRLIDRLCTESR